ARPAVPGGGHARVRLHPRRGGRGRDRRLARAPPMRGAFRFFLPWILALALALLCGVLLSQLLRARSESRSVSAAPVVTAIKKIAQLATVEAEISDVLRFEEVKSFLIFDFPKTATIRMRGRVIAGFDLTAPEFRVDPDAARRMLHVRLPAPRILAIDPRL